MSTTTCRMSFGRTVAGPSPPIGDKARQFFQAAVSRHQAKYAELQPGKSPLIGLDAEHFAKVGPARLELQQRVL